MGGVTGPVFGGADIHQNMTSLALHTVPSDSGSLLDADLPEVAGGDDHAQTIGALSQAHAASADAVRSARSAYPSVTRLSDFSDAAVGAGYAAGRGALRAGGHVLNHLDELEFPPPPDVEATSRQVRGIYRPEG